jgi:hypothetical protein
MASKMDSPTSGHAADLKATLDNLCGKPKSV